MDCKYAVRRGKIIKCSILTGQGKSPWDSCGHQRYCPQKMNAVLTDTARKCTLRERHEAAVSVRAEQPVKQTKKKKPTKKAQDKEET